MTERLYTTVDVAKVCKVSLRTVIRWVDDGKLASDAQVAWFEKHLLKK